MESRLKFYLDELKDQAVSEEFQVALGGKFAPLLPFEKDVKAITNNFTKALAETANTVFGRADRKQNQGSQTRSLTCVMPREV